VTDSDSVEWQCRTGLPCCVVQEVWAELSRRHRSVLILGAGNAVPPSSDALGVFGAAPCTQ
jgi:hypothetical protein